MTSFEFTIQDLAHVRLKRAFVDFLDRKLTPDSNKECEAALKALEEGNLRFDIRDREYNEIFKEWF